MTQEHNCPEREKYSPTEGKRRFSRVKLPPCPSQALSQPDAGQPALSPHRRKPGSLYGLENYLF